jgi:HAD superfamily hydrolase (TIGR01549 family)
MRSTRRYRAVVFDLFDTLVDFRYARLPLVNINGSAVNTTSKMVYDVFSSFCIGVPHERFHGAFVESYLEFEALKKNDGREYPSRERFLLVLRKLGVEPEGEMLSLADKMAEVHHEALRLGMDMPPENAKLLEALSESYTLGLLSNFDNSRSARQVIEGYGIERYFKSIIISVDTRWRKPRKEIFLMSAEEVGFPPSDIVFIGDNYDADIVGAKSAGFDTIWIRKPGETRQEDGSLADYVVPSLTVVGDILLGG